MFSLCHQGKFKGAATEYHCHPPVLDTNFVYISDKNPVNIQITTLLTSEKGESGFYFLTFHHKT